MLFINALDEILENSLIDGWARHFARAPFQVNKTHESDAELIVMNGGSSLLAVTIDSVSEEILEGLYREPFTMGWVTVMASFSDLAAVGAEPLGIVLAISMDQGRNGAFRDRIADGMAAACRALGVYILGGDTNMAGVISLTGCAFGLVPGGEKMTRIGCRPGDVVFLSAGAGNGNALGLRVLARLPEEYFPENLYRPAARLKEGRVLRRFATCCMDTSDGLLITLDQLIRLNHRGFRITADWEKILTPEAQRFCGRAGIPGWFMAAGIHGEFELVFTVPPDAVEGMLKAAAEMDFHPIPLGVVLEEPRFELTRPSGERSEINMAPLRNLWASGTGSRQRLIEEHHAWGKKWRLEP